MAIQKIPDPGINNPAAPINSLLGLGIKHDFFFSSCFFFFCVFLKYQDSVFDVK